MSQLLTSLRQRIAQAGACAVLLLLGVTAPHPGSVAAASLSAGARVPSTSRFT